MGPLLLVLLLIGLQHVGDVGLQRLGVELLEVGAPRGEPPEEVVDLRMRFGHRDRLLDSVELFAARQL